MSPPAVPDTAAQRAADPASRWRATRTWRLASGSVMLTYLTMHLVTHMLGLHALATAEAGLRITMAIWHSLPGTLLLTGAFALHLALALRTLSTRENWQLPAVEWLRLWAGFSLPMLLIGHLVSTRVAMALHGYEPSYGKVVTGLVGAGLQGWQIALLAPGWLHGCLGLWITLRRWRTLRRLRPVLIALVIAVPLLAALGFVSMMRELAIAPLAAPVATAPAPGRAESLKAWREGLTAAYLMLIALALGWGRWRQWRRRAAPPSR